MFIHIHIHDAREQDKQVAEGTREEIYGPQRDSRLRGRADSLQVASTQYFPRYHIGQSPLLLPSMPILGDLPDQAPPHGSSRATDFWHPDSARLPSLPIRGRI